MSVVIVLSTPAPVTVIPVTGITWLVMVIARIPYTPDPSFAVAQAVTVRLLCAVTRPDELMAACPVPLTIDQVTALLEALTGSMDALSCKVPLSELIVLDPPAPVTVIPVTVIIWLEMVIACVPDTPDPSFAVATAVTVPFAMAVTIPECTNRCLSGYIVETQIMVLLEALAGRSVADSCKVPLSAVIVLAPPAPVTVIPVTWIIWLVMVIDRVYPETSDPSVAEAIAVTVPFEIAVTRPEELIDA